MLSGGPAVSWTGVASVFLMAVLSLLSSVFLRWQRSSLLKLGVWLEELRSGLALRF